MRSSKRSPAGIEYHGLPGITQECIDAIVRLIQYRDDITKARILSCNQEHGFLLTINSGDVVAIKSGFGSGYLGEGSRGFSFVLSLLRAHGTEIEEYEIPHDMFGRLDNSCLSVGDVAKIDEMRPLRPGHWHDYIFEQDLKRTADGLLWQDFRPVMPLSIIDSRIADLAISFWSDPDGHLLSGYRRLEDIVRNRSGIKEHGVKLFSLAFLGNPPKLHWDVHDNSENIGRGQLFVGTYMAYRNRRAHSEPDARRDDYLNEFLLLNHLYLLEKAARPIPSKDE